MQFGLTKTPLTKKLMNCTIAASFAAFLCATAPTAAGQSKYTPPRNAYDGHADLDGIWQAKASVGDDIEKSIVDPSNKKIPYLPGAAAQQKTFAKDKAKLDPVGKCYMPGIPRLMYMNYPFQIFQTAKYIVVVSEYSHVYRIIYMDGSPHPDFGLPFWLGDSRGHWDGDTLVVDVVSLNDQTWLDKAADYHSDQLHVVERYTRTSADTLTYEATLSDPKVYSKDWKISVPLALDKKPDARLMEYECQELAPPVYP
jgi:hypothetical protein